jgi:pimeloyl-ACP methyl ester carboxylesterase
MTQHQNDRSPVNRLGMAALGLGGAALGLSLASGFLARDAERRAPRDGDLLEVDGASLHYVDRGSGPAIVMVHGLGGQLRNFTYALTGRLADEFRVIAIDRPGSGYSSAAPGERPDIRAQARLVIRFIEKMGLERPLLVGHSLGGALALAAALAAPSRLGGLALIAPLTQPLDRAPEALRVLQKKSRVTRTLLSRVYGIPFGRLFGSVALKPVFAPDPVPDDFQERGGGYLALRPGNMEANMFEIAASKDDLTAMVPRYGEIDMPVSILFGRGDDLLDPDHHGRLTARQLPNARFELTDGGHMLPVSHPDVTARFVRDAARAIA